MLGISLQNQVGIVTGAGSPVGIGRSMVVALAQAGAKCVYACDLNLSNMISLKESVEKINPDCEIRPQLLDVSSETATDILLHDIIKVHGRFDFFFANAGYAFYRNLNDLEVSHFDRATDVMQKSVFIALKIGSQAMMVTGPEKPKPGGNFVVTGSCSSFLGGTATADLSYVAVKTAVNGLVLSGSVQLASSNIRVNGIAPGFTKSSILTSSSLAEKGKAYEVKATRAEIGATHEKFFEKGGLLKAKDYYFNRAQEPEEIANLAVYLASDMAVCINGVVVLADSGKLAAATGDALTGTIPPVKPLVKT